MARQLRDFNMHDWREEVPTALIKVSVTVVGGRLALGLVSATSFGVLFLVVCRVFFFFFSTFKALLLAVPLQRNKGDPSPGSSLFLPAYRSPSYLPPLRASPYSLLSTSSSSHALSIFSLSARASSLFAPLRLALPSPSPPLPA